MKSISTSCKFLGNPFVAISMYLALLDVSSGFLLHQASNLTGFLRTIYHFHKLPILVREIRGQFVSSLAALFCIFVVSRVTPHIKLKNIGLTGRLSFAYFIAGFVIQIATAVVSALLVDRNGQIFFSVYAYPKALIFQVFIWCLLIGMTEETIFRGYVLQVLETRWGSVAALLLSSVLFGLDHLQNQGETAFEVVDVILSGGLLYAAAYLMTRSLWLPIGLHCGWDFVIDLLYGDKGIPRAVPQIPFLINLINLDDMLQIVLGIIFVLAAMRMGRWVGKNPLAPAKLSASSTPTSSAE